MLSIFSNKKESKSSKDEDCKSQLVGYIDKESGRQSIYGHLLDKNTPQPRAGILCIDDDIYEIDCNIYHESIENKYGHGNHGYKLYIPIKHKDGKEHIVKLIDKQTWTVCAERKIQLQAQKGSVNFFNNISNIIGNNNTPDIIGKIVSLDKKKYSIVKPNNKNEHCISLKNISTCLPVDCVKA